MKRLFLLMCLLPFAGYAQEEPKEEEKEGPHQIILSIGHAHIRDAVTDEGEKKWQTLPSWGLDYNYHFNRKWAIGLHNDIIIEDFKVESDLAEKNETISRSKPIASVVVACYKPGRHFTFLLGMGGEFAKEENLLLNRVGVEFGLPIRKGWEFSTALNYDIKWNAYDTWNLSFGIGKNF